MPTPDRPTTATEALAAILRAAGRHLARSGRTLNRCPACEKIRGDGEGCGCR